ncbi:RmlC-like cupin domain-containing protein [Cytidiella melzeri]|nr:RmlC-like cupin domain-containing protein [Cytidiella melzeri]
MPPIEDSDDVLHRAQVFSLGGYPSQRVLIMILKCCFHAPLCPQHVSQIRWHSNPINSDLVPGGKACGLHTSVINGLAAFMSVANSSDAKRHLASPIAASDVIKLLSLEKHPEGGYYVQTHKQKEQNPSPFADGQMRPLATTIYYFLTVDNGIGLFHMNKSATMHVHHQGRAEYTLIYPEKPPRVEKLILGPNIEVGEKLQLLVGTNVWKKSKLLDEDLELSKNDPSMREQVGCLISEVVFPGFSWEDHKYLDKKELQLLWGGEEGWQEWLPFVKE